MTAVPICAREQTACPTTQRNMTASFFLRVCRILRIGPPYGMDTIVQRRISQRQGTVCLFPAFLSAFLHFYFSLHLYISLHLPFLPPLPFLLSLPYLLAHFISYIFNGGLHNCIRQVFDSMLQYSAANKDTQDTTIRKERSEKDIRKQRRRTTEY